MKLESYVKKYPFTLKIRIVNANIFSDINILSKLIHGGESGGLNDRVHGISCRYSDKTSKQNLSQFS